MNVIPAKAGIQCRCTAERRWVPAVAGTTKLDFVGDAVIRINNKCHRVSKRRIATTLRHPRVE